MMLDADVVAVSPSSAYRVLKRAGRLDRHWLKPSKKGTGFVQPLAAHDHWHVDMSYINVAGTFYFLTSLLDGYSRYDHSLGTPREDDRMRYGNRDSAGREKHPDKRPRIISDNGPQFIAKEFKEFIRINGMTHVRTSPYYPQSNGKLERWHGSLKRECIRPAAPQTVEEARRGVTAYVERYNTVRLHGAIGYLAPADKLAGRDREIWTARDAKLEAARERRAAARQAERNIA